MRFIITSTCTIASMFRNAACSIWPMSARNDAARSRLGQQAH